MEFKINIRGMYCGKPGNGRHIFGKVLASQRKET
jgi:hypothetical protein